MESFESQQYRDNLAKKIKEAPKAERRAILDKSWEKTLPKQEDFVEPTPLDQLIPGIDLSKLSSAEAMKAIHDEAHSNAHENSRIGMALGDTQFLANFLTWGIAARVHSDAPGVERLDSFLDGIKPLRERFKDKIIVEIGPGRDSPGYDLAKLLDARAYIAVDPFFAGEVAEYIHMPNGGTISDKDIEQRGAWIDPDSKGLPRRVMQFLYWSMTPQEIRDMGLADKKVPWQSVADDALAFLHALPNNSVSIIMGGIRDGVIPYERLEKIQEEVSRVLDPKGAFLAVDSQVSGTSELMDEVVLREKNAGGTGGAVLYIKKEGSPTKSDTPV